MRAFDAPSESVSGPVDSPWQPRAQGLYDPRFDHDACGVAFVATLTGEATHTIVEQALTALRNLDHRGAAGAETNSGDGAGILIQVPDTFLREACGFALPPAGQYAVGTAFLPLDEEEAGKARAAIEQMAEEESLRVLGWREVRTDASTLSPVSLSTMPRFEQVFVAVYDVSDDDLARLDDWESAASGLYRKTRVRVSMLSGEVVAFVYILDAFEGGLPSASSLGMLADAAEAGAAPDDYVAALRARPCRSNFGG